jgi:hypothetical protein
MYLPVGDYADSVDQYSGFCILEEVADRTRADGTNNGNILLGHARETDYSGIRNFCADTLGYRDTVHQVG